MSMSRCLKPVVIHTQVIFQFLRGSNYYNPTHQANKIGEAVLLYERLHVLVVNRGEAAEHDTVFPNCRFSEEGGDKVAGRFWRSAGGTEAHVFSMVGTIGAGLKVSTKIYV